MEKFFTVIGTIFSIFVIAFIIDIIVAWPVMLLWNWLMPAIFGLGKITFWMAFGMMLLCNFLFGRNTNTSKDK